MQTKSIVPDSHTYVGVFRACSKLGDTQTAYDALQDMKIHGIKMTPHSYNGLIRTYAGAAAVRFVKEEHVDMYIKDTWELFETMKEDPEMEINIHILNSILLLHTNALRIEELDSKVLPLYAKFKIKHDVFTY
jgi:pentatricopeptide repeat protein